MIPISDAKYLSLFPGREGHFAVLHHYDGAFVAYLKRPGLSDFHLLLVEPVPPSVEIVELDWYGDSYDKDYQGVIGVLEVPNREQLMVSVQRDSHPVIVDLGTKKMIGKLTLADRAGNPKLRFRRYADEIWADDYDTLLRLDAGGLQSSRLQYSDLDIRQSAVLSGGFRCFASSCKRAIIQREPRPGADCRPWSIPEARQKTKWLNTC